MVKINSEKLKESFERHRASPHISIDEHVRLRQVALAQSILGKQRVYLDKKFWILIREAAMGRRAPEAAHRLLEGLRHRAGRGEIVCPISESLFLELMKQSDLETRRATAQIIDELSDGVTLIPNDRRIATEIAHFIYSRAWRNLHAIETLVWTKLSYVLGEQHPVNAAFDAAETLVIQKAFFDHMWACTLTDMMDLLGDAEPPAHDYERLAEKLNVESARHAGDIRTFGQTYRAEIRGCLSVAMPTARQVLEQLAEASPGVLAGTPLEEQRAYERQLLDYFCSAITAKEVAIALRTLHIGALCHAAVRWDKRRKLTGNDLFDFHHAEAAVGYCNVFLTDGPLQTMLQQGHMKIGEYFDCKIISSPERAAAYLSAIEARGGP